MPTQSGMEINPLKLKMSALDGPVVDDCVPDLLRSLMYGHVTHAFNLEGLKIRITISICGLR